MPVVWLLETRGKHASDYDSYIRTSVWLLYYRKERGRNTEPMQEQSPNQDTFDGGEFRGVEGWFGLLG